MTNLFERESRIDAIVTGVALLMARGGLPLVTMRNVAAEVRVSQSGLAYDLGSREQLLQAAAGRFGARLIADLEPGRGALALLLEGEEGAIAMRAWAAFRELGRIDGGVALAVAETDRREREYLRQVLAPATPPERIEEVHALSLGLRDVVSRTVDPMPVRTAREILDRAVRG